MLRQAKPAAALLLTLSCIATAFAQGAQQEVSLRAVVPTSCSLKGGGGFNAINTTIPVSAAGAVNTAKQTFNVTQVICTTSVSLHAASMNGGVRSATNPGSAFTNVIDYKGTVQFGKAKSIVNTSAIKGAVGSEAGNADSTGNPHQGALIIHIEPQANVLPLAGGSDYQDTLRITLTPD